MAAFYTLITPLFAEADDAISDAVMARLEVGEVVVEETRLDESGGAVRVAVLVHAPAETLWNVIGNCEQARRYLAGMEQCEVTIDEPGEALTHHVVDPGWLSPSIDYWFETRRQPYSRMDIQLVSGNLRELTGYWILKPTESAILLEHEVRIRPETPAPKWLVRKKLKRDLPNMMLCIRALSGGSPKGDFQKSDLDACQGPDGEKGQ